MKAASIIFSIIFLAGCASEAQRHNATAIATLQPSSGSQVAGSVTFSGTGNEIIVVADLTGLTPGQHGFHIHEKGDCSAADASSASGHFNPEGKAHGDVTEAVHHAGDLGNLTADAQGRAHYQRRVAGITIAPNTAAPSNNIVGRAVIVHANPDDLKSQPAGNSGARIACGVVAYR